MYRCTTCQGHVGGPAGSVRLLAQDVFLDLLMNIRFSIVLVVCLGLFCGIALSGCAANDAPNLEEVKELSAYPVYYAGEKVSGVPLEEIGGEDWRKDKESVRWTFYYGDCDPPAGLFADGGCAPPLQIQNYSACRRWAGEYPVKPRLFDFRGAKAAWTGEQLEIYTGRTTVVMPAFQRRIVKAAAHQLRNVRQETRPTLLPPPLPGSLSGKLPCQQGHASPR